jgi:PrtD family type I secretion system ABC transporter
MNDGSDKKVKKFNPLNEVLLVCRLMFKYALLFGCLVNLLMLATPIYSMQVLDRVISSANTDTLLYLTLVIVAALGMLSMIQIGRTFAMNKMGSWFEKELSSKLFANAVRASLVTKATNGSQQLRDLQTIKTFLTSPALISILDIPWALIFVIVLFMIHTYMGIMTVLGGVMLLVLAVLSDKLTKPLHESSNDLFISSMRQVDQASRNAEVVSVMGLLPQIDKNWQETNQKVQNSQTLVSNRQNILSELTKFIRLVLQILVTGLGAYLVLQHEMSVGAIIACSSLSGRALAPFEQAITSWKSFLNCRQGYNRLTDIIEKHYTEEQRMSLPAPSGKISADNLFYTPMNSQKHTIKGVTFGMDAGKILAVIGPSGSGKTTLAKLLVGAWKPQIGAVRIDNANLVDWNPDELGQHIGYLPQDVELFNGTVRENIGRMNREADAEKVVQAAQLAGVHEMILTLPKGYDTEIGFDGAVLSGGQRQRVGLARAFFGDPKILVLDEPNANLDSFGEVALSTALSRAKELGITTILISHRTSILSLADKILAMKDGALALYGDRDDVLAEMSQGAPKPVVIDIKDKKKKG